MFRRKHEFKPDRARHNALSKLYITPKQRLQILKWLLTAAVVIGVSVIQDATLSRFEIFGAKLNLTVVAMLLLCILLDADVGSVFILAGSAVYWFSGSAPGPYVIALLSVIGATSAVRLLSAIPAVPLIGAGGSPAARIAAAILLYCLFVLAPMGIGKRRKCTA